MKTGNETGNWLAHLTTLALAALGGSAGALAFPDYDYWFLLLPALLALVVALRRSQKLTSHPLRWRQLYSLAWSAPFFGIQIHWATYPLGTAAPWIALTLVQILALAIFSEVWTRGDDCLRRATWLRGRSGGSQGGQRGKGGQNASSRSALASGVPAKLPSLWQLTLQCLWLALAWIGVEELRGIFPFGGFPWAKLGFSQANSPLLAWAPLGGTPAVALVCTTTTLVVLYLFQLLGQGLTGALKRRYSGAEAAASPRGPRPSYNPRPSQAMTPRSGQRAAKGTPAVLSGSAVPPSSAVLPGSAVLRRTVALLTFLWIINFLPATAWYFTPLSEGEGQLQVAALQGSTPGRTPGSAFGQTLDITRNQMRQSQALAHRMGRQTWDLAIWPESSVLTALDHLQPNTDYDPELATQAGQLIEKSVQALGGVPLILGTLSYESDNQGNWHTRNQIRLWLEGGAAPGGYTKQHPVPFGEYLPARSLLEWIYPVATQAVAYDMIAGQEPALMEVPIERLGRRVPLAVPICFEVADAQLVTQAVKLGAQALVFPTSNSYFADSNEAWQQLAIARFRAAEHQRDAVQVSTMAASAFINARGEIVGGPLQIFEAGGLAGTLQLRTALSLSDRLGQWPIIVCEAGFGLGAAALLGGALLRGARRRWHGAHRRWRGGPQRQRRCTKLACRQEE